MPQFQDTNKASIVSASTLVGFRVRGRENDDLGSVEEIMIDPRTGSLAYAVLCFGGKTGFGDELYVVPWNLLRLNTSDRALILFCDVARLKGAPAFDQYDWPDFGDAEWQREIQDYYSGHRRGTKTQMQNSLEFAAV